MMNLNNIKIGSNGGNYSKITQDVLATSLVAPDPLDVAKPATAAAVIEIEAPATLMEGYELETKVGNQVMKITIPPGGVAKGQMFTVPVPPTPTGTGPSPSSNKTLPRYQVPVGHWKDGLCDCCRYSCCHASCCWGFSSFWCLRLQMVCGLCLSWPAIGATQVATRLDLDWLGRPSSDNSSSSSSLKSGKTSACTKFAFLTVGFALLQTVMFVILALMLDDPSTHPAVNTYSYQNNDNSNGDVTSWYDDEDETPMPEQILIGLIYLCSIFYFVLCIVVIYNVRRQVRKKFQIPENESCPNGMEDCCTAVFCPCCASSQMMRHTGDYEQYPSSCCSSTGHPDWVTVSLASTV